MVQTVGQRLRQRREARGASLEAVTRATKLTRTVLSALEEDRFDDLAAPVYVRGFLKLYAQYLELDADQVLEAYEGQVAVQVQEIAPPSTQLPDYLRTTQTQSRGLSPAQVVLLTATAVILTVFLWSASRRTKGVQIATRPEAVPTAPATATAPLPPPQADRRGPVLPPLPGRTSAELPRR